jgi:hypothetical protein
MRNCVLEIRLDSIRRERLKRGMLVSGERSEGRIEVKSGGECDRRVVLMVS